MDTYLANLINEVQSAEAKKILGKLARTLSPTHTPDAPDDWYSGPLESRRKNKTADRIDAARLALLEHGPSQLDMLRQDVQTRANQTYVLLIVFAAGSILATFISAAFIYLGLHGPAVVSIGATLASYGTSSLLWALSSRETRRADTLIEDLQRLEDLRIAYLLGTDLPGPKPGPIPEPRTEHPAELPASVVTRIPPPDSARTDG